MRHTRTWWEFGFGRARGRVQGLNRPEGRLGNALRAHRSPQPPVALSALAIRACSGELSALAIRSRAGELNASQRSERPFAFLHRLAGDSPPAGLLMSPRPKHKTPYP